MVEDDAAVRQVMIDALELEGYEVRGAADGRGALRLLDDWTPDLILLDLMMPKMNGVEFLQAVRADARWREVPVVALTGSLDPRLLDRLHKLGVADVMAKARFTVEQLLRKVHLHAHAPHAAATPA